MAEFDLNLSTRPFPAYRLTNIALALVLGVLAVVSILQVRGFIRYSNMAAAIRAQEQENRIEADALAETVTELESRLDRPESAAKLSEIGYLNQLILRKELSWTKLFGILEGMVPRDVHLTNLTPGLDENGQIVLSLAVRARSMADVKEFLERVEKSAVFRDLKVRVEEKTEPTLSPDIDVTLTAVYLPKRDR
jgi:Tfp pilus assembly protein PilN